MKSPAAVFGIVLFALACSGAGAGVVVVALDGAKPVVQAKYPVVSVAGRGGLDGYAASSGIKVGWAPALVDETAGRWVMIKGGDLAAAEADLAAMLSDEAELADAWAEESKPIEQRELENAYFELVESIYAAAGDPVPGLKEAKNLGQARAKIAKARKNKPGAGQGNKKTADDALEFLDMQLELQSLDLELRGYDPDWRRRAKKHVLE
jgi:hypothetical protein